jgi:Na+/H+ antiporter NhaD/arsenite permease-like protein
MHAPASHVLFDLNPFWLSLALFTATYIAIVTERLNRAIVALIGAVLMIMSGVITQQAALRDGVDFNTLGLLTGMMVIVAITRKCGVFQYVAVWSAKQVNASPWGILVMLALVTALFSAFLDNVTTVLLVAPVTLLITEELKIDPYPYLFSEIFASNIGGTATLIGDPPNIMIGSATGLTFNDFVWHLTPVVSVILLATLVPIYFLWGRKLSATPEARARVMQFNEREAITDPRLFKQSLAILALVILGFILAHPLHLEPATIAMAGAAALLLLDNFTHDAVRQSKQVHKAFGEVEWVTIFFFLGLFIVVYGIETAGVLKWLANRVVELTGGNLALTAQAILWVSAIASAVVDNIPFVATMIPLIQSMAPVYGGGQHIEPLWWALSLGACLGGNGTLIGASANLIVAGLAERAGYPIRFLPFLLMAVPLMLLSIVISSGYVYMRYFM